MLAAIFGLVGVVIGGALNAVTSWLGARRTERREIRTVARLVVDEVEHLRSWLQYAYDSRSYGMPNETPEWDRHRELLAEVLDHSTWHDLSSAYTSVKLFNDEQGGETDEEGFRVPLHGDDLSHLKWTFEAFEHALEKLYPLALGRPYSSLRDGGDAYQQLLDEEARERGDLTERDGGLDGEKHLTRAANDSGDEDPDSFNER